MFTTSEKIKILIDRAGKTQKLFAEEIGITEQYLCNIVNNTNETINKMQKKTMDKIAKALNIRVTELFYPEEKIEV